MSARPTSIGQACQACSDTAAAGTASFRDVGVRKGFLAFGRPDFGDEDVKAVARCFAETYLSAEAAARR